MSKDIPIIFSAPMVVALLDGRKTMTRRLANRPVIIYQDGLSSEAMEDMDVRGWHIDVKPDGAAHVWRSSPWQNVKPGDRLWVKETYASKCGDEDHPGCFRYRATYDGMSGIKKWKPSIFMMRKASRLTLEVTAVKVERLNSISAEDAIAEGLLVEPNCGFDLATMKKCPGYFITLPNGQTIGGTVFGPEKVFAGLWTALHGPDAWGQNPDVVAISFNVHQRNIDA